MADVLIKREHLEPEPDTVQREVKAKTHIEKLGMGAKMEAEIGRMVPQPRNSWRY